MDPLLSLDASLDPELPLTKRVVASLIADIQRGTLRPAASVPSSRQLARMFGIHRNTALAAYRELIAQGYLEAIPARGTFVSRQVPDLRLSLGAEEQSLVQFDLTPAAVRAAEAVRPDELALLGGLPDLREFPRAELYRAYRAALRDKPTLLDYACAQGHPRLRAALAAYLRSRRGLAATAEQTIVTRGSQQALFLGARAVLGQRKTIAVEQAGYPPAWDAFRLAGAELVPVPIDREGLDVAQLAELAKRKKLAAVYTTPHHQYPTTVSLSGPRRLALLDLAERERFMIIEDDYDHEFHFEGHPLFPLAQKDERGLVLHIGTLSKVFAPGLRLGYAHGQAAIIERMVRLREVVDRQGDQVLELALAYLLEEGEFAAHLRRMHRVYAARRELFHERMERELGDVLAFERPAGGLAVWARAAPDLDVMDWVSRARKRKVILQEDARFYFDGPPEVRHVRVGFARLNEAELKVAIGRLRQAIPPKPWRSSPPARSAEPSARSPSAAQNKHSAASDKHSGAGRKHSEAQSKHGAASDKQRSWT